MFIFDAESNYGYELYKVVHEPSGAWSAKYAYAFNHSSYLLKPEGDHSISLSGMENLPGIIRYEELLSGSINHASILQVPKVGQGHIWPARSDDGAPVANLPPAGQRMRLKASFDVSGFTPHVQTILNSWKKYGAFVMENTGDPNAWVFPCDNDPRWGNSPDGGYGEQGIYHQMISHVHVSDWEAINESSLMISSDSGKVRTSSITTTTTTTTIRTTTTTTRITTTTSSSTSTTISSNALDLIAYGIKGDGSDETAKLQSAFDYAASNGYKVVSFPAGKTIGISDTITFPGNMEYNGNGCTLYLLDDSYIIAESYYTFNYYAEDNVYIHHMIFDGNMNRQYRPTPPSGYYFPLRPNGGIVMYNNARFEYNEVKNYGGYMVEVSHGDNAIITHNLIHDGWQYGICTAGTDSDYSNNAVVTDNTIYRMGQVGIKIQHTSNSRFEGNTITIPGRYDLFSVPSIGSPEPTGIRLYSFDGPNNHLTITGNTITGSGGNNEIAIQSDDSWNTYITITNNQIRNAYTGINIKFNNGVITGNTINYVGTCIANSGSGNTVNANPCTKV
jgi:hypothetical protein